MTQRRVFIGDIQGCRAQLDDLLEAAEFRPGTDVVYPCGDLVNKGPDSIGTLRRLIELDAQAVLGNHDLRWLQKGRVEDPVLERWLAAQPIVRRLDDVVMLHAGLHPHWQEADLDALTPEQVDYAVTVRYCDPTGQRPVMDWPPPSPPYLPWDTFYRGTKRVVFGHWARRGLVQTERVTGLDTGCVYGGPLTAWIPEDDRVVQVPGLAVE